MIYAQKMTDALKKFEIILSDKQLQQFIDFETFLTEYNTHTNLVSAKDIDLIWEKHFVDSIAFCRYLKNDIPLKIIDIGSGGGFPVIPEAIILTKSDIFALDSTSKKTTFLTKTAEYLNLNNINIINARAENIAHKKNFRDNFDVVTARAVGNLSLISELALPFLKTGGYFIAYKSSKAEEEIKQAQAALSTLGGKIENVYEYTLSLEENYTRNLILIKKTFPSPDEFPRSFSSIKNKPL